MRTNTVFEFDDDVFATTIAPKEEVKPTPIVATFTDDPVALACASYRAWVKTPANRWATFDTVIVDREDRMMAADIRSYYNARYTMQALKGKPLTEFQHKLASFLAGTHKLNTDELGMLYRLPYFYVEDCRLDRVATQISINADDQKHLPWKKIDLVLTPLEEVFKSRKQKDYQQFWFKTSAGQAAVMEIKSDNPLLGMFRGLYKQSTVRFNTYARTERFRDAHIVYRLVDPELVF